MLQSVPPYVDTPCTTCRLKASDPRNMQGTAEPGLSKPQRSRHTRIRLVVDSEPLTVILKLAPIGQGGGNLTTFLLDSGVL